MRDVMTICCYCGCGCALYLHVEGDTVIGCSPSRNHPVSENNLCAKGWHAHQFIHSADRITKPLMRKDGTLRPVSWQEALDATADAFNEVKEQYGPDAIGILASAKCTNEENYILQKFARAAVGTNNIDHCARL